MKTEIDLDKLEAAARAATPGPWRWEMNVGGKSVQLAGGRPIFDKTVMDFGRWGMSGAAPRFNDKIAGDEFNVMERVEKYGATVPGREHHADWFKDVAHPDAQFIAQANPAVVLELVRRLRAAEAALVALTSNPHLDLGDMIYQVRSREGEGWEGPSVVAWGKAVEAAKAVVAAHGASHD